jgi:glycosyltransferase involved in cell wall biosynthesis
VIDGGSRDGTPAIVEQSGSARLIAAAGLGQAAAVNLGVAEARGDVIVVLNADDVLFPDAIVQLVGALAADPTAAAAYGDAVHIDENGATISAYPTRAFDAAALAESCYICQPASAVRRDAFQAIGGLDPRLDVALDYDFWIRLTQGRGLTKVDAVLAGSRMHHASKTLARRRDVYREVLSILRRHFGYVPYTWTYAYASWLLDRKDQFFDLPRPSRTAVLLSLVLGIGLNVRSPLRYIRDWYGHRAVGRRR